MDQIWSNLEFRVGPEVVQGGPDLVQGGPLLVQPRVSSTGDGGLLRTLCVTLEELYTERTGPQTHSDRVHSTQFLINFYSHSNS